jgi:hypothetical protein
MPVAFGFVVRLMITAWASEKDRHVKVALAVRIIGH